MPSQAKRRSSDDSTILKAASQAAFKRSKAGRSKGLDAYQIWGMGIGGVCLISAIIVLYVFHQLLI